MRTIIVLFTSDLRVRDNPALHAASNRAEQVLPLFVVDPHVPTSPTVTGSWSSHWPTYANRCDWLTRAGQTRSTWPAM